MAYRLVRTLAAYYLLLTSYCLLLAAYCLLLATCYLLLATCLLPATCYLLLATCSLLLTTLLATYLLLGVMLNAHALEGVDARLALLRSKEVS